MRRIFPKDFWHHYKKDFEKNGEAPRSVLFGFFLTTVIALAYIVTIWSFTLLILPFIYSLFKANRPWRPGVAAFEWSGSHDYSRELISTE